MSVLATIVSSMARVAVPVEVGPSRLVLVNSTRIVCGPMVTSVWDVRC